jgi:hypothetical protein
MESSCRRRFALIFALLLPLPLHAGSDIVFQNGFDPHYGFEVQTPDITVPPGGEASYCYYFHAPNTTTLGVKRWASTMATGMHHLILFATYDGSWNPSDRQPPGTLTQSPCGLGDGTGNAGWVYAAHDLSQELVLPTDDGLGTPLAVDVAAGQPLFLQMYILNVTDQPVTTSALLQADALAPGDAYTKTATYLTYNANISIAPNAVGATAQQTCATPVGAKFWWLSTRTHLHASSSQISDATSPLVVSSDWEHPAAATFGPPAFYAFSPAGLTYRCVYDNPGNMAIHDGESEATDEACIGIGYFFPATRPSLCFNNVGPL